MDIRALLPIAIQAAEAASRVILDVYHSGDFQTESKGDQSPLTRADRKAHHAIQALLANTDLPILSEEGREVSYEERKTWTYFWMVDPLDGTKEFLQRNGDFTVNIALIHQGIPVLGVVAVPVTGDIYYASLGTNVFLIRDRKIISLPKRMPTDLSAVGLRVVASRSHMDEQTKQFIETLKEPSIVSRGSSLKFMLMVEGLADIYARYAPTMEWDTAAAHAIVNSAGINVYQMDSDQQLRYNKEELRNPGFLCY